MSVLSYAAMAERERLIPEDEAHLGDLEDAQYRAIWGEGALARSIGLALGAYRLRHGLTQTELGAHVGMSQSQVARLERMDHTPSFETLLRLCDALGLELTLTVGPKQGLRREARAARRGETVDATDQVVIRVREAARDRAQVTRGA